MAKETRTPWDFISLKPSMSFYLVIYSYKQEHKFKTNSDYNVRNYSCQHKNVLKIYKILCIQSHLQVLIFRFLCISNNNSANSFK